MTQEALYDHGHSDAMCGISPIRRQAEWSRYVVRLIKLVQREVRANYDIKRLRFLLYPSRLTQEGLDEIRRDDAGVVWLGK